MTSLRASVPLLRDRFAEHVRIPFGGWDQYLQSAFTIGDWMFVCDEQYLYAAQDGVGFVPIFYHGGAKQVAGAYGGDPGVFVFVGEGIWTSSGPDEYGNWNFQVQTPAVGSFFSSVVFDGTYFIVPEAEAIGDTPAINRAEPPGTTWSSYSGAAIVPPSGYSVDGHFILGVKVHGDRVVIAGAAQFEIITPPAPPLQEWGFMDVIQYSDDHGETWEVADIPWDPVWEGESFLSELEVTPDGRWMALSSEEEPESGVNPRFLQSADGEEWESIADRLVRPFFSEVQGYQRQAEARSALIVDAGRVVLMLSGFDLQIGKLGSDGPDEFERIGMPNFRESEKGMRLFKGNYYLAGEGHEYQASCYITAFTPRLPVAG